MLRDQAFLKFSRNSLVALLFLMHATLAANVAAGDYILPDWKNPIFDSPIQMPPIPDQPTRGFGVGSVKPAPLINWGKATAVNPTTSLDFQLPQDTIIYRSDNIFDLLTAPFQQK